MSRHTRVQGVEKCWSMTYLKKHLIDILDAEVETSMYEYKKDLVVQNAKCCSTHET